VSHYLSGQGPAASTLLAGAVIRGGTIAGTLMQTAGQLLLRAGAVNDLPLAFVGATDDGVYHTGNNAAIASEGVNRLGVTSPLNVVPPLAVNAGLRVDAESVKTGAYTVTGTDAVILTNSSAGGFTVTLPAAPATAQMVFIKDVGGNVGGANTLTIGRNGKNIDGAAADITLPAAYAGKLLFYDGAAWWVLAVK
jgi:hypothetical protein